MNHNGFDQNTWNGYAVVAITVISLFALIAGVITMVQTMAASVAGGM
jgi:hypothetical protein